jgi:hypothetical protein
VSIGEAGRHARPEPHRENLPPKHDPFDALDAEDESDTGERVLGGGADDGDGDADDRRREFELEEDGDASIPCAIDVYTAQLSAGRVRDRRGCSKHGRAASRAARERS